MHKNTVRLPSVLILASILASGLSAQSPAPAYQALDLSSLGAEAKRQETLEGKLKRGNIDLGQSTIQYWSQARTESVAAAAYPREAEELAIVDHAPTGELPVEMQRPTVYVMFNLPMVPLAKLGEPITSTPWLTINPPVAGVYRWYGTRVLSFQPNAPLVDNPRYTVTVSADASSLGGRRLGKAFAFEFNTEAIKVVNFYPGNSPDSYQPAAEVPTRIGRYMVLEFNQPVDPAYLKQHLAVSASAFGGQRALSFATGRPDYGERLASRSPRAVLVTLDREPPEDAQVTVTLKDKAAPFAGYPARKGDQSQGFHTITPFRIKAMEAHSWDLPRDNKPGAVPVYVEFSHNLDKSAGAAAYRLLVNGKDVKPVALDVFGTVLRVGITGLEPDDSVLLQAPAAVKDKLGRPLFNPGEPVTVRIPKPEALVSFPWDFHHLEAAFAPKFIWAGRNLDTLFLGKAADDRFRFDLSARQEGNKPALLPYNMGTWRPNKVNYQVFDLAKLLNPAGFGTAYFNLKSTFASRYGSGGKETTARSFAIQVTDLGITVRMGFNRVLVWVNSLSTGKPVAGATVDLGQLSDTPLRTTQTDETGLAVFGFKGGEFNSLFPVPDYKSPKKRLLVAVSKGSDRADMEFSDTVNSWSETVYGHDSARRVEAPLSRVMIFTDRGLYKGGEELALRGIHWLQSPFGFKPYAGSAKLELKDSRSGKVLWTWNGNPSANGGFATRFRLPEDLEPGLYSIRYIHQGPSTSRYGDDDYNFCGVTFQVANFRRLAFQVNASVPDRPYYQGADAAVTVNASYLSGGAMPKADYSYYWTRKPVAFMPPGPAWANFVFGPGNWEGEHTLTNGKGSLGANGQAVLNVKTSGQNATGSAYDYVLETTVQDIDRQAIANTAHVLVHPASFYLGLRFTSGGGTGWWSRFVSTGKAIDAKAVLVDPLGRPWKPDTKFSAVVLKADWKATEQQGVYGKVNTRWEYTETEVSRQALAATNGEAGFSFQVPDAGDYLLAVEAKDPEGRSAKTVIRFYATGSNWVRRATETPSEIELIADKELYLPGETAHILVRSPVAEGDYLLTTEREGIYNEKIIHLKGGQSLIDVPVAEKHVPVFYVALTSCTKREAPPTDFYEPDLGRPRSLFGVIGLKVSTKPVELDVSLTPDQSVYQPGKEAMVTIKVTRNGKPVPKAEVTALAVDRAVLDLINYHVPDPVKYFYNRAHFPLAVEGDDSRRLLMKPVAYDTSALTGGGEDGEKPNERKDFRPLALFDPFVVTDDQGEARVRFKFPDSLTTYRMTALVVSGARVGIKEGELFVRNPINVRAALPRKFRNRDTAAAGVILQNLTAVAQKVEVSAESSLLSIGGPKTRSAEIPPNGVYELPFILSATTAGQGTISFTVKSAAINEKLTEKVVVEQPLIKEAFTTVGTVARGESAAAEGLVIPSAIAAGYGSLSLQASSTLRPFIEPSLARLLATPEAWWGQYRRLLYAFAAVCFGGDQGNVAALLKDLRDRQQPDGGIYTGSYGRQPWLSDPYISLLSAHFLELAAARKYALGDAPDLGRLLVYLGGLQNRYRDFDPYFHAYNNFVLASGGKADKAYLNRTDAEGDKLGLGGYGLLCQAWLASGDKAAATQAYRRSKNFLLIGTQTIDLKDSYEVANYWSSEIAEIALLLRNASAMGEDRGFILRLAGTLNKNQRHWQGLNDDLWTMLGFLPVLDAEGPSQGSAALSVSTGKQALAAFSLSPQKPQDSKGLEFGAAPLAGLPRDQLLPLDLAKTGDSPVYYTMILRYALPNEAAYARDEGLEVTQRYETLDGAKVGERELKLGETYRVRTDVSSTKRRARLELLVPIPNGMEIVDPTFTTTGKFANQGGAAGENIQRETVYGDTIDVAGEGYGGWSGDDWYWYWYQPDSFALDNLMVYRWQDFYAGTRTVTFLARVTTPGVYPTPPASASLEFEPEVFGRSEGKLFVIKP